MTRNEFQTVVASLVLGALAAVCLAPRARASAPQEEPPQSVAVEQLGETAFRLRGAGANVGLCFGADGILLVDGNFLRAGPELEATIGGLYFAWRERVQGIPVPSAGGEALPYRYVVNTHWHVDHTATNSYFALAGARVIAHETVRRRLMGDPALGAAPAIMDPPMDAAGWPTITFEDSLALHFDGEEVRVLHFPLAHTDGDCVVWLPSSKLAFLGDIHRSDSFPYIELQSGARPRHLLAALERLLELLPADTRVVPGHGPATDMEGLRAFAEMFADCDRQIRKLVGEGKPLSAAYDMRLFGEYEDFWGEGKDARARGFIQLMWFCYAPKSQKGLGELELDAECAKEASNAAGSDG